MRVVTATVVAIGVRAVLCAFLCTSLLCTSLLATGTGVAHAAAVGSDNGSGSVSVGASNGVSSGGHPGRPVRTGAGTGPGPGPGSGSRTGAGTSGGGHTVCSYQSLALNDGGGFAPGGPTPGGWYSVTCIDVSTGASTTETEWIADQAAAPTATPAQAPVPAVDPYSVALQAENTIDLPRPTIHTDPAGSAVVNLATWLWIDRPEWHPYSVSATVGPVTATAVATPVRVTWSMGEGDTVTCTGPGTPFDLDRPASSQATDCSFTYRVASAGLSGQSGQSGQTGPDGAAGGSFVVSAAIDWSVSWSAQGAAGGGTLPALVTTASSRLRVEQVESINSYQALAGTSPAERAHLS